MNHKLAVIRTLLERCYSIVTEEGDRKKEEEHVAKALSKCGYPVSECTWTLSALEALRNALYKFKTYLLTYLLTYPPWTIDRVKQDIVEKSLKDEAK